MLDFLTLLAQIEAVFLVIICGSWAWERNKVFRLRRENDMLRSKCGLPDSKGQSIGSVR